MLIRKAGRSKKKPLTAGEAEKHTDELWVKGRDPHDVGVTGAGADTKTHSRFGSAGSSFLLYEPFMFSSFDLYVSS